MRHDGREKKNRKRKTDRLDEYNALFHPYYTNDGSRVVIEIEWDEPTVNTYKIRLEEIKSIYNYYKKIIKALLFVGIAILGLSAGVFSLFCQCELKQLSCENLVFVITSLVLMVAGIIFDLILLYRDPEKYFSDRYTFLREIINVASSAIDYWARLGSYYEYLTEQYEKEAYHLKATIKPSASLYGVAVLSFLVATILKFI